MVPRSGRAQRVQAIAQGPLEHPDVVPAADREQVIDGLGERRVVELPGDCPAPASDRTAPGRRCRRRARPRSRRRSRCPPATRSVRSRWCRRWRALCSPCGPSARTSLNDMPKPRRPSGGMHAGNTSGREQPAQRPSIQGRVLEVEDGEVEPGGGQDPHHAGHVELNSIASRRRAASAAGGALRGMITRARKMLAYPVDVTCGV
jgi:hypothetical protein